MVSKIIDLTINKAAPEVLKKRIEWLMDNGATKIDGSFHFALDEVPTASIRAEMILFDKESKNENH